MSKEIVTLNFTQLEEKIAPGAIYNANIYNSHSEVNVLNAGLMDNASFGTVHGGETNIANMGTINNLHTSTVGATTNVLNDGFIDNFCAYDAKDQTNILNSGLVNKMYLSTGHHGEFNVSNFGAINQLSANISKSSILNLFN